MKIKRIFLLSVFLSVACMSANSQGMVMVLVDGSGGGKILGTGANAVHKAIGTAGLECMYDYTYLKDTLHTESAVKDVMRLQVGDKVSKFHSYKTFLADSLFRAEVNPDNVPQDMGSYAGGETYSIFKYPGEGKLVYTDEIARDFFRYEEALEPQPWEILDDTREILGYACQKAVCSFRGRDFEAWFTPEIPVDQGPWKFGGLPGLIMAAGDTDGHHYFEMTGIRETGGTPVTMADVRFHKSSRKDFLKTLYKYKADFISYLSANSGINVAVSTPDGMEMEVAVLKYDFLERDYR